MIFDKNLKQENKELKDTCKQLDNLIDYKNRLIEELQYRLNVSEKSNHELNNIVNNLLEERRKYIKISESDTCNNNSLK